MLMEKDCANLAVRDLRQRDLNKGEDVLRVIVAGEFRSGKSAVLNAIARDNVMPRPFAPELRYPAILRYSDEPYLAVQDISGQVHPISAPEDAEDIDDVYAYLVGSNQTHLKSIELIELSFEDDESVSDEAIDIVKTADVLIWLTIASQAWRLSEKSILDQLEDVFPQHMLLAVSRGDKLRSETDRDKISGRLHREAGEYFSDIIFLNAPNRLISDSKENEKAWAETSGQKIYGLLAGISTNAEPQRAADVINIKTKQPCEETPVTLTPLAKEFAELTEICTTLTGVIVAGVFDDKTRTLMPLHGDRAMLLQIASVCSLLADKKNKLSGVESPDTVTSEITLEGRFLIQHTYFQHHKTLFMFCNTTRITPAIARSAFTRMSGVLEDAVTEKPKK